MGMLCLDEGRASLTTTDSQGMSSGASSEGVESRMGWFLERMTISLSYSSLNMCFKEYRLHRRNA